MPKKSKLRGAWSNILPQESIKGSTTRYEMEPWRCRFCNSALIRFSTTANLRVHITKKHNLVRTGRSFRDLEAPSGRNLTVFNGYRGFLGVLHLCGTLLYFKSNDYCVLEVIGITFFPSKSCTCKSPENSGVEVVR